MQERSFIIQLSNQCPCLCPGCYNYDSDSEIETTSIIDFLSGVFQNTDIRKLTLSGGDPLLRKDILIIVRILRNIGFHLSLDTVGFPIKCICNNNELQEILQNINCLGLPLDGITTETIQCFRPNCSLEDFQKIISEASNFHDNICVNTVAHKQNVKEFERIADYICTIPGVKKWQIFQFMPIGPRGYTNRHYFNIDENCFDELSKKIVEYCRERSEITVECKSVKYRKNKYIFLGTDGIVWYPVQSPDELWNESDANDSRRIIGNICSKDKYEEIIETLRSTI